MQCLRVSDEFPCPGIGEGHGGGDLGRTGKVAEGGVGKVTADAVRCGACGNALRAEEGGDAGEGSGEETAASGTVGEVEGGTADLGRVSTMGFHGERGRIKPGS